MKNKRLILGIVLFILGFIGVLSLLTMDFPMPEESAAILQAQFSNTQIKYLPL